HGEGGHNCATHHGEDGHTCAAHHGEDGHTCATHHGEDGHTCAGHHGEDGHTCARHHGEDGHTCAGHHGEDGHTCAGHHGEDGHSCCAGHGAAPRVITLDEGEAGCLRALAQTPFLPLARFMLSSTKSPDASAIAYAPVAIEQKEDDMAVVATRARALETLCEKGLVTLDYDQPLENFDYAVFRESRAFAVLSARAQEGGKREGFLFDTASVEPGSFALTALGQVAIAQLP
ncbi:MAG: hypothetical protein RR296_13310, partial [Clostridia bacterium]